MSVLPDPLRALLERFDESSDPFHDSDIERDLNQFGKAKRTQSVTVSGGGRCMVENNPYDSLAGGPNNPRWWNTAQWTRNSVIRDGLLKPDSPCGIWEIADKGHGVI